jgi:polysaccharide biosynthesis protein PslJ
VGAAAAAARLASESRRQGLARPLVLVPVVATITVALMIAALRWVPFTLAAFGLMLLIAVIGVVSFAKRDATTLLILAGACLFLVPENYVLVGPLKSYGNPALVVGALCALAWLIGRTSGALKGAGDPIVHGLMYIRLLATATAFLASLLRPLTPIESAGTSRAVMAVIAGLGITLLACDAIRQRRRLDDLLFALVLLTGFAGLVAVVEFAIPSFNYSSIVHIPGTTLNGAEREVIRSNFSRILSSASDPIEFAVAQACFVPIALHFAQYARSPRRRHYAVAATIAMLSALPMTVARSGVVAIVLGLIVYGAHWKGRARLNALVLGIIGLATFRTLVPGLLGTVKSLFLNVGNDPSVKGRTEDYSHIPMLLQNHMLLGRGIGTFQPLQYFFLDNQYLGSLLEGGVIGLLALCSLFIGGMYVARSARKWSDDPSTRSLGQALAAGIAALAVAAGTFDELGFRQTAFALFFFIGCAGALRAMTLREWRLRHTAMGISPIATPPSPPDLPGRQVVPAGPAT